MILVSQRNPRVYESSRRICITMPNQLELVHGEGPRKGGQGNTWSRVGTFRERGLAPTRMRTYLSTLDASVLRWTATEGCFLPESRLSSTMNPWWILAWHTFPSLPPRRAEAASFFSRTRGCSWFMPRSLGFREDLWPELTFLFGGKGRVEGFKVYAVLCTVSPGFIYRAGLSSSGNFDVI